MPESAHTMMCMEVWGGNTATDNGVVMAGLDAWVYSRPHGDAAGGGDVHYVSSCATGRITRLLLADVSGHGLGVAEVAGKLRAMMRRYVNFVEQTQLVRAINRDFSELTEAGNFATAVVVTFWGPTRYVMLCNAGHPRPLWYRAKTKTWIAIEPEALGKSAGAESGGLTNIPLGIAAPATYDQFGLKLRAGDLILLYTDALIEALAPDGKRLREAGLLDMVRTLDATRPDQMIPSLLARLAEFRGGVAADDDETVLLLRPNELRQRRAFGSGFAVLGRYAKAAWESFRPGGPPFPWPQLRLENIGGAFWDRLNERVGRGTDEG